MNEISSRGVPQDKPKLIFQILSIACLTFAVCAGVCYLLFLDFVFVILCVLSLIMSPITNRIAVLVASKTCQTSN